VNPATARITGYSADELLAMEPAEANQIVHPEDRALLVERARLRQQGEHVPPHYEFRLIRKDGAVRWIECFNTRIIYHGQAAVQMTYIDITSRKEGRNAGPPGHVLSVLWCVRARRGFAGFRRRL
jgi:PAS domain S-box-containing protein